MVNINTRDDFKSPNSNLLSGLGLGVGGDRLLYLGGFRTWGGLLVNVDLFSLSVVSEGYLVTRLEVQLAIGRNGFCFFATRDGNRSLFV